MSNLASTQKYLDIAEIKNDCLLLKDGSLRAVLFASSINFALKSEEEQKAVIQAYSRFLNTLKFISLNIWVVLKLKFPKNRDTVSGSFT